MLAVMRLEMKKTFFAKRGLWVYLLALAPVLLFVGHAIIAPRQAARLQRLARLHPVNAKMLHEINADMTHTEAQRMIANPDAPPTTNPAAAQAMAGLLRGLGFRVPEPRGPRPPPEANADPLTRDDVVALLGDPYNKFSFNRRNERGQFARDFYYYTDGQSDYTFRFDEDGLRQISRRDVESLPQETLIFATIFQFFYLRLAIFFGCVGVFINLFRGEMIDKSLHYYLLTPIRRELLAVGKFLAGLIATVVIFTTSTALQLAAMLWAYSRDDVQNYLHTGGWGQIAAYLGVTVLACAAYGSIFLAAGLIFKNPILPAAFVLIWESANLFLPATLKQMSLIYYLQSLCPVTAPPDREMPRMLQLLLTAATPASTTVALLGVIIAIAVMLIIAMLRAPRLEINYSTD
jgi:ABC-type transport system involved in multi-copper enzyme maturation permease subunit